MAMTKEQVVELARVDVERSRSNRSDLRVAGRASRWGGSSWSSCVLRRSSRCFRRSRTASSSSGGSRRAT